MEEASPLALADLSPAELRALTAAAAWYAKRHEAMITRYADDTSASAAAERERYLNLHSALGKLGIRLRLPDGLPARDAAAA
jgi:hypothetical protein